MENTASDQENYGKKEQPRLPYHAPELIGLGQIQAIVQASCNTGSDGAGGCTCAS